MSWESTGQYYRLINEASREALGGLHSASIAMFSVDFEEIEELQRAGAWDSAANILAGRAAQIEAAGAELLVSHFSIQQEFTHNRLSSRH